MLHFDDDDDNNNQTDEWSGQHSEIDNHGILYGKKTIHITPCTQWEDLLHNKIHIVHNAHTSDMGSLCACCHIWTTNGRCEFRFVSPMKMYKWIYEFHHHTNKTQTHAFGVGVGGQTFQANYVYLVRFALLHFRSFISNKWRFSVWFAHFYVYFSIYFNA